MSVLSLRGGGSFKRMEARYHTDKTRQKILNKFCHLLSAYKSETAFARRCNPTTDRTDETSHVVYAIDPPPQNREKHAMTYLTQLQEAVRQPSEPTAGFTPLTDQILALTAHLPPIQLLRPWSIDELLPQLQGRYQKRPATREVAKALTQLGWQQKRCWKKSGLNRRFWWPPIFKEEK